MNKVLMGNAFFLGSYARYEENRPLIDTTWWQNDGVVNTSSMIAPSSNATVIIMSHYRLGNGIISKRKQIGTISTW